MAALTTLSLPLAVRSMIDNGFSKADSAFVDRYFYALFAIAALSFERAAVLFCDLDGGAGGF